MTLDPFRLDPRLEADGPAILDLPLCQARLVNDARYVWVVLVPRRPDMVEIMDLEPMDRLQLMDEICAVGRALKEASGCDKLNVAALGNMVRQLHIHLVGRTPGDPGWPGPVFGFGARIPLEPDDLAARAAQLRRAILAP